MNTDRLKDYGVLGIAGFCLLLATAANAAKPAKIDVCHVPPGNPENIQLIQVGAKGGALAAHLSHGDYLVSEEMCDAIADNNCDGIPGTPAEDDASCNDNDPTTADSCVAGACVNVATCPCNYAVINQTAPPWDAITIKSVVAGPQCVVAGTTNATSIAAAISNNVPTCNVRENNVTLQTVMGLTSAELNACAADIDVYANALDAQAGITVTNVGTPCPTF